MRLSLAALSLLVVACAGGHGAPPPPATAEPTRLPAPVATPAATDGDAAKDALATAAAALTALRMHDGALLAALTHPERGLTFARRLDGQARRTFTPSEVRELFSDRREHLWGEGSPRIMSGRAYIDRYVADGEFTARATARTDVAGIAAYPGARVVSYRDDEGREVRFVLDRYRGDLVLVAVLHGSSSS